MGYIKGWGFEIYRLRDAKVDAEYLIYNVELKTLNFYSSTRAISILMKELKIKKINLKRFFIEELKYDIENTKFNLNNSFKNLIDDEIILIDNVGFRPNNKMVYEFENKKYFNSFNYLETFKRNNYVVDGGFSFNKFIELCPYHYQLFSNLHNFDDEAIKNTLLKISDKLRFPDEKAQDCIIFYPAEGAGKGIFYKYVLQPLFGKYTSKILMNKLKNEFNAFLREALVLIIEEGKRDVELVEILKEFVTESSTLINEKGKNQQEEPIYFLTFVFSNHMNPIDLGKRRGSYHICKSLGKNISESQAKGKVLCENLPLETEIFLKYLHNLDFEHQEALEPFNTIGKQQVNDLNKNPLELFYDALISFPTIEEGIISYHKKRYIDSNNIDLGLIESKDNNKKLSIFMSKDIIKDCYNNFCFLEGFRSNLIRHNKDIVQLWALLNIDSEHHKRILIKGGINDGRKIDHINLIELNKSIKEAYNQNGTEDN